MGYGTVDREAGPVAGAFPDTFGVVERDNAPEVCAGRRDRVHGAGLIAEHRAPLPGDADDRTGTGGDIVDRVDMGAAQPIADKVLGDLGLRFEKRDGARPVRAVRR